MGRIWQSGSRSQTYGLLGSSVQLLPVSEEPIFRLGEFPG